MKNKPASLLAVALGKALKARSREATLVAASTVAATKFDNSPRVAT